MAQFDVYKNSNPKSKDSIPFLLDVQADILSTLATRVVVPLIAVPSMGKPIKHLTHTFRIMGASVVMSTAELAAIDQRLLVDRVGSLKDHRDEILAALDFLVTGF